MLGPKGLRAYMAYTLGMAGLDIKDPIEGVDIESEYKLIQQKKSNLSARERKMVVYRYESTTHKEPK